MVILLLILYVTKILIEDPNRFHAGSYCYQRALGGLECVEEYPIGQHTSSTTTSISSRSLERFSRLLKGTPAYCQYYQVSTGRRKITIIFIEKIVPEVSLLLQILHRVHISTVCLFCKPARFGIFCKSEKSHQNLNLSSKIYLCLALWH